VRLTHRRCQKDTIGAFPVAEPRDRRLVECLRGHRSTFARPAGLDQHAPLEQDVVLAVTIAVIGNSARPSPNAQTSGKIIPLKGRTDFREQAEFRPQTIRVRAAGGGTRSLGPGAGISYGLVARALGSEARRRGKTAI
jgi:hypothetical protein